MHFLANSNMENFIEEKKNIYICIYKNYERCLYLRMKHKITRTTQNGSFFSIKRSITETLYHFTFIVEKISAQKRSAVQILKSDRGSRREFSDVAIAALPLDK